MLFHRKLNHADCVCRPASFGQLPNMYSEFSAIFAETRTGMSGKEAQKRAEERERLEAAAGQQMDAVEMTHLHSSTSTLPAQYRNPNTTFCPVSPAAGKAGCTLRMPGATCCAVAQRAEIEATLALRRRCNPTLQRLACKAVVRRGCLLAAGCQLLRRCCSFRAWGQSGYEPFVRLSSSCGSDRPQALETLF